jgi:hypothetical protein
MFGVYMPVERRRKKVMTISIECLRKKNRCEQLGLANQKFTN